MRSFFNVDSVVTTHRLIEMRKNYFIPLEYELHAPLPREHPYDAFPSGFSLSTDALEVGLRFLLHPLIEECLEGMKSGGGAGSRSMVPSATNAFVSVVAIGSTVEKHASINEGSSLRKHSRRGTSEQLTSASRSTTMDPIEKGKEPVEIEEAPEWGYTLCELCEVEDRAGVEKYFTTIMTWLKATEGEDPLVPRWSAISESSQVWIEGPLSREYLQGALYPVLVKQVYECFFEELMNRADKSIVWGLHFVNALIDRVHDAGRLARSQHERILMLRAANKELKHSANQDLVAATEPRAKELEEDVNKVLSELESLKNQRRELKQEVGVLQSSLDGARNDWAHLKGRDTSRGRGTEGGGCLQGISRVRVGPREYGDGQLRVRVPGVSTTPMWRWTSNNPLTTTPLQRSS
ncbi:hypothetical protein BHE74_00010074 [Ensete ventricosum]|nr:hypothetical protein BHE74_00010074 [Ensete ventricosum]